MFILIFARGEAGDLLELVIEVREVIEAAFKTYLRYGKLVIYQQFAGITDLDLVQELREGFVRMRFEITAKGRGAHISHFRYLLQGRVGGIVVHNELVNFIDPFAIVFISMLHKGVARQQLILPGAGHGFEDRQQRYDPANALLLAFQCMHLRDKRFPRFAPETDTPSGQRQQPFNRSCIRHLPETVAQEVFFKVYYHGLGYQTGAFLVIGIVAPVEMRDITAVEHQVTRPEAFHAIPYVADTGALLYQHDLILRMKMPGREKIRLQHFHDLEGFVFVAVDDL